MLSGPFVLLRFAYSPAERVFRKEHKRSVTCAIFAPLMSGVFMTGSQDTTVKVFVRPLPHLSLAKPCTQSRVQDLRNKGKTRAFSHSTTVRSIAFSPFQPTSTSPFNDILVATEGGDIFRWDIRSPDKPMDRVLAAHKGAILGMDWVVGSERGNQRSWVCTGGVDGAVKVCNYCHVANEPTNKSVVY
jgi:WD40 repeat protein